MDNTFYINNTKIANELRKGSAIYYEMVKVEVGGRKRPMQSFYGLEEASKDLEEINWPYAMAIADAVYTVCKRDRKSFTVSELLHILSGDEQQKASSQKKKEIERQLQVLSETTLWLDCVEEIVKRGLLETAEEVDEWQTKEAFLPLKKEGKKYCLKDIPLLYRYAEKIGQIISFPDTMLQAQEENGKRMPANTKERILIKRNLVHRLEIMKNPNNRMHSKKILYGGDPKRNFKTRGFLEEVGIRRKAEESDACWQHRRLRVHKEVCRNLDYFKRKGYLREGYKEVCQGNYIEGVIILGEIHSLTGNNERIKKKNS